MLRASVAALALLVLPACYHAIVETGRPAGSTVVMKPWVATWVYGIVPAKEISVAAECPSGIAKVETQQTFVNGLVGLVTLGIYTPQTATITCAASGRSSLGPTRASLPLVASRDTSIAARIAVVQMAAELSARSRAAVLVRF
jgi:hypothetical protein